MIPTDQVSLNDLWIEQTFGKLVLPSDAAEARRLLTRMHRLIAAALRTLNTIEGVGGG